MIDARVEIMIQQGLIDEARGLWLQSKRILFRTRQGQTLPITHCRSLITGQCLRFRQSGTKKLISHFQGALSLRAAIDLIKQRSRNYAKRQFTWLAAGARCNWVDITGMTDRNPFSESPLGPPGRYRITAICRLVRLLLALRTFDQKILGKLGAPLPAFIEYCFWQVARYAQTTHSSFFTAHSALHGLCTTIGEPDRKNQCPECRKQSAAWYDEENPRSVMERYRMSPSTMKKIVLIVLFAAIVVIVKTYQLVNYLTLEYVKASQAKFAGLYAEHRCAVIAAYMGIYIAVVSLSIPGAVPMTLAGGALFGFLSGTIAVLIRQHRRCDDRLRRFRFLLREWVQKNLATSWSAQ